MRNGARFSILLAAAAGVALGLWALQIRTGAPSADSRLGLRVFQGASLGAAIACVLSAPLFTLDARSRRVKRGLATVAGWVFLFFAASLFLRASLGGVSFSQIASVSALLLVFATSALGLGLLASVIAEDEISAGFWSAVVLAILLAAPLVAGPWIPWLPATESGIEAVLVASPLVSVATASGLDLLRTETFYRWTPIGQRRFQYPDWRSGLAFGLALSGLFFGGAFLSKELRPCVSSSSP